MKKKIIIGILILIIIVLTGIAGYFFVLDIETQIPEELDKDTIVETEQVMGRKVFTIYPQNVEKSGKVILYFHGGAYIGEATKSHWKFLEKLSKDTNSTIIMPDYPLAPKYTYKDVMKMVEEIYKKTIAKYEPENIVMMGDSAGAGITLGLAQKLSMDNVKLPSKTILISPWLDTGMSNEKIDEVQKNDKDLSKWKLALAAFFYARDLTNEYEYFVNPINGNFSKLKNVVIYTGTYDILNPDCYVLQEKAKNQGVDIKIKEYEKASHIWIVNNDDGLAIKAYQDLLKEFE